MEFILLIVGLVVVASFVSLLFSRRRERDGLAEPWPYYPKKLLSRPEQVLYYRLVKALPECAVFAQVQMSRVLGVKKGNNFQRWYNRIGRLSLDYVVCLKDSTVVVVIELDDPSHDDPTRREADSRKAKALSDAGVPLIRWNVASIPDEATIRKAIASGPPPRQTPAAQV